MASLLETDALWLGELEQWLVQRGFQRMPIPASRVVGPTFSTWTPLVTQGVAVTFTTNYAKYWQFGKLIVAECALGITSAGTLGSQITVGGLPQANAALMFSGAMMYFDAGTAWYHGGLQAVSATSVYAAAHGLGSPIGITPSFATANGDALYVHAIYEGA